MFLPVLGRYLENLDVLTGITQDITCKNPLDIKNCGIRDGIIFGF